MRTTSSSILSCLCTTFAVAAACNSADVNNAPLETLTDGPPGGGSDDGADDTDGEPQLVCVVEEGMAGDVQGTTYRWHCDGHMDATVKVTIAVDINGALEDVLDTLGVNIADFQYTLDYIASHGWPIDSFFGPGNGDSFEDPAVIACCENGYSYPNTPAPTDPDAQHAWACAVDCLDQSCRAAPKQLRDFAEGDYSFMLKVLPSGCLLDPNLPCYYDQLYSVSNYIANRHNECVAAFYEPKTPGPQYVIKYGGSLDVDEHIANNEDPLDDNYPTELWPSLSNIEISAGCEIEEWHLPQPPQSPAQCTSSNDNNDEAPFGEIEGGGFPGGDLFVSAGGEAILDGPTYMGIEADGSAPLKGVKDYDCRTQPCSFISVFADHYDIRLKDLVVRTPEALAFVNGNNTLSITDFQITLDSSAEAPLNPGGNGEQFAFHEGELTFVASAKLYGVPVRVPLTNSNRVTGELEWKSEHVYTLSISPVEFDYTDLLSSNWALQVDFGELVPLAHAPRAGFTGQWLNDLLILNASTTVDPDGDALSFEWFVDGATAGTGNLLTLPYQPNAAHTVTLRATDSTGRDSTLTQLFPPPTP